MSQDAFQTFLTGSLLLLVIAALTASWLFWRWRDAQEQAELAALEGVTQELKLNLQRMLGELMMLADGQPYAPGMLLPVQHPQLDAVNAQLIVCDRRAIAVMCATYQELQSRKHLLETLLADGQSAEDERENMLMAAIDGLVTLYLWDEHEGRRPHEARSTRSWAVRDWMKANGFGQFQLPGIHLRDAVVERLRQFGMVLTPKPLELTAFEYWSRRYDRHKDPRGVFGARRFKPVEVEAPEPQAEDETYDATPLNAAEDPVPHPAENEQRGFLG